MIYHLVLPDVWEKLIKADIEVMDSFSAHADRNEMMAFIDIQKNRAKKIFLVHGELDSQKSFQDYLKLEGFDNVVIPELGEEVKLRE